MLAVNPLRCLAPRSPDYPSALLRGGADWTPPVIHALGKLALLLQPLTALFCSTQCPGQVFLRAFDQVAQLRNTGRAVISGFPHPGGVQACPRPSLFCSRLQTGHTHNRATSECLPELAQVPCSRELKRSQPRGDQGGPAGLGFEVVPLPVVAAAGAGFVSFDQMLPVFSSFYRFCRIL